MNYLVRQLEAFFSRHSEIRPGTLAAYHVAGDLQRLYNDEISPKAVALSIVTPELRPVRSSLSPRDMVFEVVDCMMALLLGVKEEFTRLKDDPNGLSNVPGATWIENDLMGMA